MNDETKAAADAALVESMVQQLRDCVSVGDEMTLDHACLIDDAVDWIAGEPARLAAALENLREACATECEDGEACRCDNLDSDAQCGHCLGKAFAETVRATPLDATPLADELDEAQRGEREAWRQVDEVRTERDALRARVAELEADAKLALRIGYDLTPETQTLEEMATDLVRIAHQGIERAETAEAALAEAHERLDEFGMRRDGTMATLVEGIDAMRERIDEYRAEWYTAEAQVAAARAWAKTALDHHEMYGEDESGAYALLRAMDEATKK